MVDRTALSGAFSSEAESQWRCSAFQCLQDVHAAGGSRVKIVDVAVNMWRFLKWGYHKSFMFIGVSLINLPFWGIPIYGTPHVSTFFNIF